MTKETAERIVRAAEQMGYEAVKVYKGYSGRGMFGKTTFAVQGDNPYVLTLCIVRAALDLGAARDPIGRNQFEQDIENLCWDDLGQDRVCY